MWVMRVLGSHAPSERACQVQLLGSHEVGTHPTREAVMEKDPVTDQQCYQDLKDKYQRLLAMPIQGLIELEVWFNQQAALMREINQAGYTWHCVMDAR